MATRADFYILQTGDTATRWQFACQLIEQVFKQGLGMYVHTPSEADAMRMETTMLREQLAAREAAESALKQMGIVGTLVGSCGGTSGMARTATAFIADPDGVERGSTPSGEIIQC